MFFTGIEMWSSIIDITSGTLNCLLPARDVLANLAIAHRRPEIGNGDPDALEGVGALPNPRPHAPERAADAAGRRQRGDSVGVRVVTGAGDPKLVPRAIAEHILREHGKGGKFRIVVMTGASTSSELDGVLAMVDGIELRMPYNSDPIAREKITYGKMEYFDFHLGAVAQYVRCGFFGQVDRASIEFAGDQTGKRAGRARV